jgi:hypothetical protein
MTKFAQIFALVTTLSFSSVALAQTVPTPVTTPSSLEVVTPLAINQPAPFAGLLLSPEAVARIIVDRESVPQEKKIAIDHAVAEQKAKDDAQLRAAQIGAETAAKSCDVTVKARENDINVLTKKLAEVENKGSNAPWYLAAGAVGGVVVTALTFFVVGAIQK